MKKICILICALLLLAGCSSQSNPETQVKAYLKAEALNDSQAMRNLVEPGKNPDPNWLAANVGNHVLKVDLKKVSLETTIDVDRARVHVSGQIHYTFDNPVDLPILPDTITVPVPVDRTLQMVKIDGGWFISPEGETK